MHVRVVLALVLAVADATRHRTDHAFPLAGVNYVCTWSLQNYMGLDLPQASNITVDPFMGGDGNALANAHMNATYVYSPATPTCRGCGWAQTLHPLARSRLTFLLDAGWEEGTQYCMDPVKFPLGTCAQRLASVAGNVTANGWFALGLWMVDWGVGPNATAELLASVAANVSYWCVRGVRRRSPSPRHGARGRVTSCPRRYRRRRKDDAGDNPNHLTALARRVAPSLIVEHAAGAGPLNGGPRGTFSPADAASWFTRANDTDVFRTYDVTQQLAIPTTLGRVAGLLPLVDAPARAPTDPRAILNAEDECILSVALLGSCGIMRYPQTGLRSPDWVRRAAAAAAPVPAGIVATAPRRVHR